MRGAGAGLALAILAGVASHSVHASDEYRLLRLDGTYVKWGKPDLGTGAKVRYALVTKPTRFPGARNCQAMVPVDAVLGTSKISPSLFESEVAAAFAMWQAAADITFDLVDDEARADIVIGAQEKPQGWAYADVSHAPLARSGTATIDRALICLNTTRPWKVGFGGDVQIYDLRVAMAHEIGHAIGLNHPSPRGQVMSFEYGEQFRILQEGDRGGGVALYGKRPAPIASLPLGATKGASARTALK